MKICSKCGEEKNKDSFYKDKSRKDGLSIICKTCSKIYYKKYYKENKEKIKKQSKEYREANREKYTQYNINYYKENKYVLCEQNKAYREINKEKYSEYNKEYRKLNREKLIAKSRKHYYNNKQRYIEKEKSNAVYENYSNRLTNDECARLSKDGVSLEVKCRYCGKYFIPTNKEVRNRIGSLNSSHSGVSYLYCSNTCKKACPVYRQVKYPKKYRKTTSREVGPLIRQLCFKRDNWECQICGKNTEEVSLHCHHIEGYTQNPRLGNDLDNIITLCKECHKQVHKLPGCNYHELKCN
jgi:hypothetical protein